jgi:bis(5'-nucleosyl)-tetraphosphatase (symmetrical)
VETLFVGDVQGCALELQDLLEVVRFDETRHRLALCGDPVIGNHEVALLAGKRTPSLDTVRAQLGDSLPGWLRWLEARPLFVREDGFILVHAGIAPGKRPEQCTREELTEIRTVDGRPWFDSWPGPETVIFGHWAQRGKVDLPLCKGLDTGCVYGGRLTGLWWPRLEWVSVPARRRWFTRAEPTRE